MNNEKIKIVDGFVFKKLTSEEAKMIFNSGVFELYCLHSDGSESLIESIIDLGEAIENEEVGIEVGHIERIKELENALLQVKSQLIDGGYSVDSVMVISIDTVLIKNHNL